MKIVDISIKNFRGIKFLEKLRIGTLSGVVGKNDAGKSIIMHALDYFFDDKKIEIKDIYKAAAIDDSIYIEIRFEGEKVRLLPPILKDEDGYLRIKKECNDREKAKLESYLVCNDFEEDTFNNLYQKTTSQINSIARTHGITEPLENIHDLIEQLIRIGIDTNISRSMVSHLVKSSNLKSILEDVIPKYSMFAADTSLDTNTAFFQNQFRKLVTDAIESNSVACATLKNSIDNSLNAEVDLIARHMSRHYPELRGLQPQTYYDWNKVISFDIEMEDNSPFKVPIKCKGTGLQRLLMVSYFQYLADKQVDAGESYIFAVEEPETYLHPGAQRELLTSLIAISETSQIILTTHSPVFASVINKENLILATKNGQESTYRQGDNVAMEDLAAELGVRADDALLMSKLLIFVEGSNDVKFWKIVKKKFTGLEFDDADVILVPGGGNELHNIAEMNLMHRLNRNFLVIIDKDAGACDYQEKCRKAERLKHLVESKGGHLIVLRKREIENYYHPQTVKQILADGGLEILDDLEFFPYEDVSMKLKTCLNGHRNNFKLKNNMDVFERMELECWQEVSKYQADTGEECCELSSILQKITELIR